jgi:hypothetical protein
MPFAAIEHRKLHSGGEAVQSECVFYGSDPHPAAVCPADHREQDRGDSRPNRGIARPQQIDPADRPLPPFAAASRDPGARRAGPQDQRLVRQHASIHAYVVSNMANVA